jgi:hypothetical protein
LCVVSEGLVTYKELGCCTHTHTAGSQRWLEKTTAVRVITPLSQRPPLPSDHPPTTHPPTPHAQAFQTGRIAPLNKSVFLLCVCDTLSFSSTHHAASQAIHRSRCDEHNNRAHSTAAPCPIGRPALVHSFLTHTLPALPTHAFCLFLLSATHKCCCCADVAVVKGRAGPTKKTVAIVTQPTQQAPRRPPSHHSHSHHLLLTVKPPSCLDQVSQSCELCISCPRFSWKLETELSWIGPHQTLTRWRVLWCLRASWPPCVPGLRCGHLLRMALWGASQLYLKWHPTHSSSTLQTHVVKRKWHISLSVDIAN